MREELINECKSIEENCTYTAETHHTIANSERRKYQLLQIGPAIISVVTGGSVSLGFAPAFVGWLTLVSGVVAAISGILNPSKNSEEQLAAAKQFTTLKQDARALGKSFSKGMSDDEFSVEVRKLHDRYNELVLAVPATNDKAFEKAREKVKKGVHEPD